MEALGGVILAYLRLFENMFIIRFVMVPLVKVCGGASEGQKTMSAVLPLSNIFRKKEGCAHLGSYNGVKQRTTVSALALTALFLV